MIQINAQPFIQTQAQHLGEATPDGVNALQWQLATPKERQALLDVAAQSQPSTTPEKTSSTLRDMAAALPAPLNANRPHHSSPAQEKTKLDNITQKLQNRLTDSANNKSAFYETLQKSFGNNIDMAKAETIRQQAQQGDFSWMPKIKLMDSAQMSDTSGTQGPGVAKGAYAKEDDTIFISRELLNNNPLEAEKLLAEELGHGLDARLNKIDSPGDEGEIFSKLLHGEKISEPEMKALKSENDHGVINVNGRQVEVEYGFFGSLGRSITGAAKSVVKEVGRTVEKVTDEVGRVAKSVGNEVVRTVEKVTDEANRFVKRVGKEVVRSAKKVGKFAEKTFKKIVDSKAFAWVTKVLQLIPFPPLQAVGRVFEMAKMARNLYLAAKNGSWGAVLGGLASMAPGVGDFISKMGAPGLADNITKWGGMAKDASTAYKAVAQKNYGAAIGLFNADAGAAFNAVTKRDVGAAFDLLTGTKLPKNASGAIDFGAKLATQLNGGKSNAALNTLKKLGGVVEKFETANGVKSRSQAVNSGVDLVRTLQSRKGN
jgi:hypothetical protein